MALWRQPARRHLWRPRLWISHSAVTDLRKPCVFPAGTFLCNSEKARIKHPAHKGLPCLWESLNQDPARFHNPAHTPGGTYPHWDFGSERSTVKLKLWTAMFLPTHA